MYFYIFICMYMYIYIYRCNDTSIHMDDWMDT